jgi:hypothetical protein
MRRGVNGDRDGADECRLSNKLEASNAS